MERFSLQGSSTTPCRDDAGMLMTSMGRTIGPLGPCRRTVMVRAGVDAPSYFNAAEARSKTIEAGRLAMLWTVSPQPTGRNVRLSDTSSGRIQAEPGSIPP